MKRASYALLTLSLLLPVLAVPLAASGTPLETVDWAPDSSVNGMGSGTLGSINVSYTTTVGGNSGKSIGLPQANWDFSEATDDAVGAGATHLNAGILGVIGGTQVQVVGRVSMDLITLDVSDLTATEARPGAMVDLLGGACPIDDVAAAGGTVGYELLTSLGERHERRYVGDEA